jgi:hypothetical protein
MNVINTTVELLILVPYQVAPPIMLGHPNSLLIPCATDLDYSLSP